VFGLPPGLLFAGLEISAIGYVPYNAAASCLIACLHLVGAFAMGSVVGGMLAKLVIGSRLGVNYFRILGVAAAYVLAILLVLFTLMGSWLGWPVFLTIFGLAALIMALGAWVGAKLYQLCYRVDV
jgi:hypothetical protein